jgi:hypothetical protein
LGMPNLVPAPAASSTPAAVVDMSTVWASPADETKPVRPSLPAVAITSFQIQRAEPQL